MDIIVWNIFIYTEVDAAWSCIQLWNIREAHRYARHMGLMWCPLLNKDNYSLYIVGKYDISNKIYLCPHYHWQRASKVSKWSVVLLRPEDISRKYKSNFAFLIILDYAHDSAWIL